MKLKVEKLDQMRTTTTTKIGLTFYLKIIQGADNK